MCERVDDFKVIVAIIFYEDIFVYFSQLWESPCHFTQNCWWGSGHTWCLSLAGIQYNLCKMATLKKTQNLFFRPIIALCRPKEGKHSAILSTFIKLPFVIKISVLSIFEWPFYTGFTVPHLFFMLGQVYYVGVQYLRLNSA